MGADALKLELLDWLLHVENNEMLHYLKVIKDQTTFKSDCWENLTTAQKAGSESGLSDIHAGRIVSHDEVKKKYGL